MECQSRCIVEFLYARDTSPAELVPRLGGSLEVGFPNRSGFAAVRASRSVLCLCVGLTFRVGVTSLPRAQTLVNHKEAA